MMVRTILAVRAFGIVVKNGDAVLRRSITSENLAAGAVQSVPGQADGHGDARVQKVCHAVGEVLTHLQFPKERLRAEAWIEEDVP